MKEIVFEAGGMLRGSSAPALETYLRRQAGVHHASASYMSDTVTVGYDENVISKAAIGVLIEQCGYHCRGEIVPAHLCAPTPVIATEHRPPALAGEHTDHPAPTTGSVTPTPPAEHIGHTMPAAKTPTVGEAAQLAHAMGTAAA